MREEFSCLKRPIAKETISGAASTVIASRLGSRGVRAGASEAHHSLAKPLALGVSFAIFLAITSSHMMKNVDKRQQQNRLFTMPNNTNTAPVLYGQVVVGPPGSGKTTYCNGMQQYLGLLGRDAWVINLDPANETYEDYDTLWNIGQDLVNLTSVMEQLELGPNGGLLYCMEYLERHIHVLVERIQQECCNPTSNHPRYLLFDFPGQVELFTHGTSVSTILQKLSTQLNLRLCAVNLMDATYCVDATKFLAATLVSTTTMLRLELPTVHILSKVDLLEGQELPFGMDFFTECNDLERLVPYLR